MSDYMPQGGVDVTQQYMPKGGADVTNQYQNKDQLQGNLMQNIMGETKKHWGLGAIQDILAPLYLAGQEVAHGKNPTPYGGNRASPNELNDYAQANPFATKEELQGIGGNIPQISGQIMKDTAGAASWAIPATKVIKGANFIAKGANLGLQGATQGGLQAASQEGVSPESIAAGIGTGAIVNPLLGGAGNILTKQYPRYLGFRAYGKAGLKLPEVLQAQREYGTEDLKGVRDYILSKSKGVIYPNTIMQSMKDLAKEPEWTGTPGLSQRALTGNAKEGRKFVEPGVLENIETQLSKSTDMLDFYNRLKNSAYPTSDSAAANRIANFMRVAAHKVREQIINTSNNPEVTRNAMDTYAAQMAMKDAKSAKSMNTLVNKINQNIPLGQGGLSVLGLLTAIPGIHQAALPMLIDAALSNKVVAPKLASGLLRTGEAATNTGVDSILTRLGVGAAISAVNPTQSP